MGSVGEALELFIQSLELTAGQRDEVSRQHTMVREALRQRLKQKTDFLSGSYSRNTAIRPLHDIDILVVLGDATGAPPESPDAALKRVRVALKEAWPNKELPILQQHSVHTEFTKSGIEFDVVPAYQRAGQEVFLIPERNAGTWVRTNPKRHQEVSTQCNERAGKKLKPLIKAVKHWNRQQDSSPLGSFHLEVMCYDAFSSPPAGGYLEGLEALYSHLAQRVLRPCPDPAGLGEHVDARVKSGQREAARNLFMSAARTLRLAREERDKGPGGAGPASAHARLRAFFGNDYRER